MGRLMANLLSTLGRWIKSSGLSFFGRSEHSGLKPASQRPEHQLGAAGERFAAEFLKRLGYQIIATGHRQRLGEIDIVAVDRDCVVFVEVKTWRSSRQVDPSVAVDLAKQGKLTRTALAYLKRHRLLEQPARFDVVTVVWRSDGEEPVIRHFKHAFEAVGVGQMFR
jgi:putative endonuclease